MENNYLSSKQIDAWSAEMKSCQASGRDCGGIIKKYEELSTAQQKQLISDCATSPATCQQKYGDVLADSMAVKQALERAMGKDIPIKMVYDLTATWAHQMDADGIIASNKVSEQIMAKYGLDQAQADIIAGVALSALGGVSKAGKGSGSSASSTTKPSSSGKGSSQAETKPSSGAENVATYPKLKDELVQQNLNHIAKQDPRLDAVVKGDNGKLNYGVGSGTKAEADRLGKIWVGDGARLASDGSGLMSADGTRVYRFPASKDNSSHAITGTQANFETFKIDPGTGDKTKVGNGHMDIR